MRLSWHSRGETATPGFDVAISVIDTDNNRRVLICHVLHVSFIIFDFALYRAVKSWYNALY